MQFCFRTIESLNFSIFAFKAEKKQNYGCYKKSKIDVMSESEICKIISDGKYNVNKIYDVISFCKKNGFTACRLLKLAPVGKAILNWHDIGIDSNNVRTIIKELVKKNKKFECFPLTFAGFPELYPCRPFVDAKGCQAGNRLLHIDSKGYIYPCACSNLIQRPSGYVTLKKWTRLESI